MNGNRGAKGSIKDRLISMLYRLRYKKKQKKEDEYRIYSKLRQLEHIERLQNFKEKEDVDLLDEKEIQKLRDIKFNVSLEVPTNNNNKLFKNTETNKTKPSYYTRKKFVGIENNDVNNNLKLQSIESKTTELDEILNLNTEKKKTKDEIVILKEVENFIKKSTILLNEIKEEVSILKEESKDKTKSQIDVEERYKRVKEKVNKLKEQYSSVKDKYDLSEFSISQSIKLLDSIKEYKSLANLNEMEMMVNVCKHEIDKIDNITIIKEDVKSVGENIDKNKTYQKALKIKFNRVKEKTESLTGINDNLNSEINNEAEKVNEMLKKATFFEKKYSKEIQYVGVSNILSSLVNIAGGILTIPLTGLNIFGTSFGVTMINKELKKLNQGLETKEEIIVKYNYEDISSEISSVKDKMEYTNLILKDSLNEIQKLKVNLYNEFSKNEDTLPESNQLLNKVIKLEKNLLLQQEKISKVNNNLEKGKELNKQKLKKVGE